MMNLNIGDTLYIILLGRLFGGEVLAVGTDSCVVARSGRVDLIRADVVEIVQKYHEGTYKPVLVNLEQETIDSIERDLERKRARKEFEARVREDEYRARRGW